MPLTPSQAGPLSPIWPEIIKKRTEMCRDKAGRKAFFDWLHTQIHPLRWDDPNKARDIAILLRGAPYPDAWPLEDIRELLGGRHDLSKIGRWTKFGHQVFYPTEHLDGHRSAPSAIKGHVVTALASAIAKVRLGLEMWDELDPVALDESLTPAMRKQMLAFGGDVVGRLNGHMAALEGRPEVVETEER